MADKESTGTAPEVGLIAKAFLMGLGAAVSLKDKAEELANEMFKKGQMFDAWPGSPSQLAIGSSPSFGPR